MLNPLPSIDLLDMLVIGLGMMAILYGVLRYYKQAWQIPLLHIVTLLCLIISAYTQLSQLTKQHFPLVWQQQDLQVAGQIVGLPRVDADAVRFILQVDEAVLLAPLASAAQAAWGGQLQVSWYRNRNPKALPLPDIRAGESWQFVVRAKQASGFINQAGFDYERWLFSQRIAGSGYVRDNELNQRLQAAPWWSLSAFRQGLQQAIQQALPNSAQLGLVQGLALGERSAMSDAQWALLNATGTNHLLAISGLHIVMVASLGILPAWLLAWCYPTLLYRVPRQILQAGFGLLFATGYSLLAGMGIPTQRTLLMLILFLLGMAGRERIAPSVLWCMALLAVLLLDPLAPLAVGFWLSFCAAGLLVILSQRQLSAPKGAFISMQVFLSVAMLPLTALLFGNVSWIGPVANLFAIPWVTFVVVPLILLGIFAWLLYAPLAFVLWQWAAALLAWLEVLLNFLAELPQASWSLPAIPWYWIAWAFVGVALLLLPKGVPGRYWAWLCFIPMLSVTVPRPANGDFVLHVLDVGQGSATVVRTANHTLLVDAGAKIEDFDLGRLVVVPWLKGMGISTLDKALISHDDVDHSGGMDAVLHGVQVAELLTNTPQKVSSSAIAHHPMLAILPCVAGQHWQWDGVDFAILHPTAGRVYAKDNDGSCVLQVSHAGSSALITGDIEQLAEAELMVRYPTLTTKALIVPHHGSKSSSSLAFLRQLSPQVAVMSSGYLNRYHHPAPSIVKRYASEGIPVLDTQENGEVELRFRVGEPLEVIGWRPRLGGIWSRF